MKSHIFRRLSGKLSMVQSPVRSETKVPSLTSSEEVTSPAPPQKDHSCVAPGRLNGSFSESMGPTGLFVALLKELRYKEG